MTDPEVSATLKKVSALVASMVDPVTVALEEMEHAKKSRRAALVAMALVVLFNVTTQFWVLRENARLVGEIKTLAEHQGRMLEEVNAQRLDVRLTGDQIQALLKFAFEQNEESKGS